MWGNCFQALTPHALFYGNQHPLISIIILHLSDTATLIVGDHLSSYRHAWLITILLLLVLSQHANNSGTWISEIRILKILFLIVLVVANWVQALLDAKLV